MKLLESESSVNVFLLVYLSLCLVTKSYSEKAEDGFIHGVCPRLEDIHPCTCSIFPKTTDESEDFDYFDSSERRARVARSATLSISSTDAPSPEGITVKEDGTVHLNLRLDIGTSLADLFASTTPSTLSSLLSTSSPIFFAEVTEPQVPVTTALPIDESSYTLPNDANAKTNDAFFSPSVTSIDDSVPKETSEEISDISADSSEGATIKSQSDIYQASLSDFTTPLPPSVSSSSFSLNIPASSAQATPLNLELAESHRETSKTVNTSSVDDDTASTVKFAEETQETSSFAPTTMAAAGQSVEKQTESSIARGVASASSDEFNTNAPATDADTPAVSLTNEQLPGQVLPSAIVISTFSSLSPPPKVTAELPANVVKENSASDSVSNRGSNLASMDTREGTMLPPKMVPSVAHSLENKRQQPHWQAKQKVDSQSVYSPPLPIAIVLSSSSSHVNNSSAHTDGDETHVSHSSSSTTAELNNTSRSTVPAVDISTSTSTSPLSQVKSSIHQATSGVSVDVTSLDDNSSLNDNSSLSESTSVPPANDSSSSSVDGPLTAPEPNQSDSVKRNDEMQSAPSSSSPSPDNQGNLLPVDSASTSEPSISSTVKDAIASDESGDNLLPVALAHSGSKSSDIKNSNGPLDSPDSYDIKPVHVSENSADVKIRNDSTKVKSNPVKTVVLHWSLQDVMFQCRNVHSARVITDVLNTIKGYHMDIMIFDNVTIPDPFPFALFSRVSFNTLEFLNVKSLQFNDNFSDKSRNLFGRHGRSGATPASTAPLRASTVSISSSSSAASSSPYSPSPSQGFYPSTSSWWKK